MGVKIKTGWTINNNQTVLSPGHPPAAGQHPDPGDPGVPGERAGGEGPEEAVRPGAEEPAAGRVPAGESWGPRRGERPAQPLAVVGLGQLLSLWGLQQGSTGILSGWIQPFFFGDLNTNDQEKLFFFKQ